MADKSKILEKVKELLDSTTETEFSKLGYERIETSAGVYGNGETYGHGADNDKFDIKIAGKTDSFVEKQITFGGKRIESLINLKFDENKLVLQYKTPEIGLLKVADFIVDETAIVDVKDNKFVKALRELFKEIAKWEVNYILTGKFEAEGLKESYSSENNEIIKNNIMKRLTLKDLFLNESELSEKTSSVLEEDKKVVKTPEEVTEEISEHISEVTMSGDGSGIGAFLTPYAFKKTAYANKTSKRPKFDKDYNIIPQKDKDFYTKVDIKPESGYVPKGMDKNFVQGKHSENINEDTNTGVKLDLTKKKIFSIQENIEKGINKRYLVTERTSKEYEQERWKKMSNLKTLETIKEAEELTSLFESIEKNKDITVVTQEIINESVTIEPKEILSEEIIMVKKPNSNFAEYKFYQKDFMNENKSYILDLNSMVFVQNPNAK